MMVPLSPVRCLHRAMDVFPDKVGVVCGSEEFTYCQFGQRAEKLATALGKHGIAAGDRVGYLSLNTHQLLEGYFGVPQAQAIVMPLNVRLAPAELVAVLNHSGASMLIFEPDFAPLVEKLRAACTSIRRFVTTGDHAAPADLSYEELLEEGTPERADIFRIDESSIAELFYTSGSTGSPKGVALSHRTLYLHALSVGAAVQTRRNRCGPAHHSAVSRKRLGTSAGFHAVGSPAGDGAAIRAGRGVPAHPGAPGHRYEPGAHHGEHPAELPGYRAI